MPYFDRINVSEGNKFTIQISEIEVLRVPRLAGLTLIFVYMRSFAPVCRDEYVKRYCFEFSSI